MNVSVYEAVYNEDYSCIVYEKSKFMYCFDIENAYEFLMMAKFAKDKNIEVDTRKWDESEETNCLSFYTIEDVILWIPTNKDYDLNPHIQIYLSEAY